MGIGRTNAVNVSGGGTGGASFYKCASVGSGTWTGYKAVQDSTTKIWSFEQSLTTDALTFGGGFTPEAASIYNADATAKIASLKTALPVENLIFYAPLTENTVPVIGPASSETETFVPTYSTYKGIPAARFDGTGYIDYTLQQAIASGAHSFCFWLYLDTDTMYKQITDTLNVISSTLWDNELRVYAGIDPHPPIFSRSAVTGKWLWFCYTCDASLNATVNYYFDGADHVLTGHLDSLSTTETRFRIGRNYDENDFNPMEGYISSIRIYQKVLTSDEQSALKQEFTPAN